MDNLLPQTVNLDTLQPAAEEQGQVGVRVILLDIIEFLCLAGPGFVCVCLCVCGSVCVCVLKGNRGEEEDIVFLQVGLCDSCSLTECYCICVCSSGLEVSAVK